MDEQAVATTHVLVVEDEENLRRTFVRSLAQHGYRTSEARTVRWAVDAAAAGRPAVIVLDLNLPDGSGWDVLRGLAERGVAPPAVVAISAVPPGRHASPSFIQRPFCSSRSRSMCCCVRSNARGAQEWRATKKWIVLPYDGSVLARASLRRAAADVRANAGSPYTGILLAIAGVDPDQLQETLRDAQALAGAAVPLEARLLPAGDPIGAFRELVETLPDAVIAAPLGTRGGTGWYARACTLTDLDRIRMLFFISPREIKAIEDERYGRHRVDGPLRSLLRACARRRPGLRSSAAERSAISDQPSTAAG